LGFSWWVRVVLFEIEMSVGVLLSGGLPKRGEEATKIAVMGWLR
jgi:hypothetical protein